MRAQLLKCIAVLFSMPLVVFSGGEAKDDVKNFLAWLDAKAATECVDKNGKTADNNLIDDCKIGKDVDPGSQPSDTNKWDDMCEAAGKTVTCVYLPNSSESSDTKLYSEFKDCCTQCAKDNADVSEATKATACCAACPNPIDYFLFWAENDAATACSSNSKSFPSADCTKPAKLGGKDAKDASYEKMCTTLENNVGCEGLDDPDSPSFTEFKSCATGCKTKDTVDQQMGCVEDTNCGYIAPTTHTTTKPATAGPPTPPAPETTTSASVIPKTTTETEGEDSDGNGTGPTDTSAPLLPPTAIWAKVIALTALIAKLI